MRVRTGRLSEVVEQGLRADWSWVKEALVDLEPGGMKSVECPAGVPLGRFRSTVLVTGRRIDYGEWVLRTRTAGRRVQCFLVPKDDG